MKPLIPDEALDKHVALLGMTGAGKSSVIRAAIVEPDLEADRRVIIITPKDDWWGLRLSKTGKSKGFDIPIFGGWHGDYPLNVKDAALLAEAYATMKGSAIFVTSRLSVQDRARWFSAFAETILSKNKGWARLVIDEAHVFMPKQGGKGGGAIPAALHAGNELVSQGRSLGLRIVLASQRSAKLHNDALTQCSCLIAMLLMAPHDRDAVKDWIEDQADPVKGKEIVASLANLEAGQAWVWAPRAKMLEKIQFPMPRTFDSSAAPDDGATDGPQLTPINLDALKGKLATVEAEKKANDPKELKTALAARDKEIVMLKTAASQAVVVDPQAIEAAEKRGFYHAEKKLRSALDRELRKHLKNTLGILRGYARKFLEQIEGELEAVNVRETKAEPVTFTPTPTVQQFRPFSTQPRPHAPKQVNGDSEEITRPLQKIIDAVRWWNVMGIVAPSQSQVAFVAGYSHKSGTWATYLSQLRKSGLIEGSGELRLTGEGAALVNEPDAPPSGDHLRAIVLQKINGPLAKIMKPILNAYPEGLAQQDAGDQAGYSSSSGTWATYLSRLRSLDLIEGSRELKAQEWLFP